MQTGFIFGQGTDISDPKELARRRAIVDAMMAQQAQQGAPRNLGEGIFSAGNSIANALTDRNLKRKEDKARQDAAGALPGIVDLLNGGTPPFFPSGSPQSQPIPARDPNSSEAIASDTMSALGKPNFTPGDRDSFVAAMMPHAMEVSKRTGLDPRLVIAQAAQETGWGKSAPGNNFFGIKSHGKAGGNNLQTREFMNGQNVTINDSFRAYGGMGESAQDYAQFLMDNPRYRDMLSAGDLDGQLAALGRSGYATDPNYASSVGSIARSIQLPGGEMPSAQSAQPNAGTRTFNPEIINQLAALSSNPYASEGQRQIAALLMQQQVQQMMPQDPMKALELERAQLEIQQMRNPQAEYNVLSADEVAQLGLPPGSYQRGADGKISQVGGAGTNNNITLNTGTDTGDYLYGTDGGVPNGWRVNVRTGQAEPIPGGPVATEAEANAQKAENTKTQGALKLGTTLQSLNLNIAEIENGGLPVTGAIGDARRTWLGRLVTGDSAADFGNRSSQITDAAALAEIQNMRDNSPTGGAVGSLTDGERIALGNARTAMNASTSAEEYVRAAKAYRTLALDLAYGEGKWTLLEDGTVMPVAGDGDGWTTINGVRVREKK